MTSRRSMHQYVRLILICIFSIITVQYTTLFSQIEQPAPGELDNKTIVKSAEIEEISDDEIDEKPENQDEDQENQQEEVIPIINAIIVEGNKNVPAQTIIARSPFQVGQQFTIDVRQQTSRYMQNLFDLGYFSDIKIMGELISKDRINIIVIVKEKQLLQCVTFEGNKHLTEKEINKKINFKEIPTVDEKEVDRFVLILKKLYQEKNYHNIQITPQVAISDDCASIHFVIKEGKRSTVKRVRFVGNDHIPAKHLRSILFTREDWPLSFMDRAGTYNPDAVEADKHAIENYYQSNGFFNAKVVDAVVDVDQCTQDFDVTFHIQEGDIYTISEVHAPGNDCLSEEVLLARIPIKVCDLYSRDKIRETLEYLRLLWGEFGYINADIEPMIEPNDETKTVALTFYSDLGEKVYLNRITIIGNKKTRDKVIRRQLLLDEGDLITTKRMDESKERVESLGYFEQRDGVNWRIIPIDKNNADLELYVKEIKTGKLEGQLGFGGAPKDTKNATESLRIGGSVTDTNLFGTGIAFNLNGSYSKQEQQLLLNVTQPYLFDNPIYSAIDVALKRTDYEDFRFTQSDIIEKVFNAGLSLGFISKRLDTKFITNFGGENINYPKKPEPKESDFPTPEERIEFQHILDKRFIEGGFVWLGGTASQDYRNHPIHPSRGYQWLISSRLAVSQKFGFVRIDLDGSWYNPLIGERDLVAALHAHLGTVAALKHKIIPYRELFHVGGPATVRGFLFGEIGPTWRGDSIGAKHALWLNAELIFPIAPDFSIKGCIFYDGGAGWDTPDSSEISPLRLRNNGFDYRHAIGFGVRVYRPTPIRVDWGFKLDRRRGESESEVHFTMSHEF